VCVPLSPLIWDQTAQCPLFIWDIVCVWTWPYSMMIVEYSFHTPPLHGRMESSGEEVEMMDEYHHTIPYLPPNDDLIVCYCC